jgi:hypothetical protein
MREKTVVALYDHFENAKSAVAEMIGAGAARDTIALLANTSTGDHPALSLNPAFAREEFDTDSSAQSGIVTGAEVGVGLGGLMGFLIGISSVAIPGIGFLIAAGTWATVAAGAAAGGAVGAIVGALTDHGVSDKDAHLYAEGLKRGGTLITAVVPEDHVAAMTEICKKHGAIDIEDRVAPWNAEGWVSFEQSGGSLAYIGTAANAGSSAEAKVA